jgi:hypothetical protein
MDRVRRQIVADLAESIVQADVVLDDGPAPLLNEMSPGSSPGDIVRCMTSIAGLSLRYIGQTDPADFLGDLRGHSLDLLREALRRPLNENVDAVRGLVATVKVGDAHGMGEIAVLAIVTAYQARRSDDVTPVW